MPSKICSRCRRYLSCDNFYINSATSTGLSGYCKDCDKKRKKTPEYRVKANETQRKYYKNNPEYRERAREYARQRTPEEKRQQDLKKNYNMTLEDFMLILEQQRGCCAICGTNDPYSRHINGWCVDHNHNTGRVRGILCHQCNVAVGHLQDSPELCDNAAQYLSDNEEI